MPQTPPPDLRFTGLWAHVQDDRVYGSPFVTSQQPFYRKLILGGLDLLLEQVTLDLLRAYCARHAMAFTGDSCWINDGTHVGFATLLDSAFTCDALMRIHSGAARELGAQGTPLPAPVHLLVPVHLDLIVDDEAVPVFSLGQCFTPGRIQGLTPTDRMGLALQVATDSAGRYLDAAAA